MNPILLAPVSVAAIGGLCALLLTAASKFMHVPVDKLEEELRDILPGANCGSCGFAGCDGYAAALAEGGVSTNLCTPGGDLVSQKISGILGLPFLDVVEMVAVVRCGCTDEDRQKKMEYQGIRSCAAAKQHYGGAPACTYGCIGLGDCIAVCPRDAICIKNGVAHVNLRKCIGCGKCAKACPNDIIWIHDDNIATLILCNNHDKGADVRKKCANGCIACRRCVKECPSGAIEVADNLARIDYAKCGNCGHCATICPAKCIKRAIFTKIPFEPERRRNQYEL